MELMTQSAGKRVQASQDWFYFLLDNKKMTRAYFKPVAERPGNAQNPENDNHGITIYVQSGENCHSRKGE